MTIRQRRKAIVDEARSILSSLEQIEEYCGSREPFALSEEEFSWIGRARDYVHQLTWLDINEKPKAAISKAEIGQ